MGSITRKDMDLLNRLLELSRLEKTPTAAQEKEFSRLQSEMALRLKKSMEIEDKTRRLLRYLKAA